MPSPTLPIIRLITDMRTRLNDVYRVAVETREPIVLAKNGTAAFVLMDSNAFDAMQQRERMHLAIHEAEIEERYQPESISREESNTRFTRVFAAMSIEHAPSTEA